MAVHTPAGAILYTGDFKVDYTPIEGGIIDSEGISVSLKQGCLVLLSESTNAERPGYTATERKVGELQEPFCRSRGKRIIVATFSSNIHRIQQIIKHAESGQKGRRFGQVCSMCLLPQLNSII